MKIAQLVFFGFLVVLLLFSATTWINFRQSERVQENTEFFAHSTNVVRQSNRFQRNILNIVSSMRAYFLTGERTFLTAFDSAMLENRGIIRELDSAADAVQRRPVEKINVLNQRWNAEFTRILAAARQSSAADSSPEALSALYKNEFPELVRGEVAADLQREVRDFINAEYRRREESKTQLAESIAGTRRLSFTLTLVSIVIGLVIAGFLSYHVSTRILRMVRMANSIAEGQYNSQVAYTGRDELGRLAGSLNHMAQVLHANFSELKRKNAELDQFAHIVSHDLKSPLRGISNVVSWIEEDHHEELPPKVQEYMALVKGRLERAEHLISGILTYARIGREQQARETVVVRELLEEVLENQPVRPGLRVEFAHNLPLLFTERLPLYQVFANLVSNAVKYHDKTEGHIRVYHRETEQQFVFFVNDDGPGIDPAYHRKIFQIFQTLQEKESFESTGVGLAIVKKILDARQETVEIQSAAGSGTTISFTWKK
ncbi:sensor histidine kinase [Flaviaesturariibacter amylovorans]|uniref:histidine kinase n=1 Tax=Flaviaesturariibacter amylovorans TaxID=1084520 RepID=A0ABP8HD71_9BACT